MKRRRPVRREGQEASDRRQVRRTFVDPSQLKASELKAVVCLFLHGEAAPFLDGHAFCRRVNHPSIDPPECTIGWQVIKSLVANKLANVNNKNDVILTGAGRGIGRSLANKPILGYD